MYPFRALPVASRRKQRSQTGSTMSRLAAVVPVGDGAERRTFLAEFEKGGQMPDQTDARNSSMAPISGGRHRDRAERSYERVIGAALVSAGGHSVSMTTLRPGPGDR